MFKWLKKLFFKEEQQKQKAFLVPIKNLQVGDLIKLKFKDPRKWGLDTGGSTSLTPRIDYTDLETRILCGCVMGLIDFNGILAINFQVIKQNEYGPYHRNYVFLEEEIEHIEQLSGKKEN